MILPLQDRRFYIPSLGLISAIQNMNFAVSKDGRERLPVSYKLKDSMIALICKMLVRNLCVLVLELASPR